jgi:probable HAF family extracellular repeat protein
MKSTAVILTAITLFCALAMSAQQLSTQLQGQRGDLPHYRVIDLGTLGGTFSFATGISNNGLVDGFSNLMGDMNQHAFLWRDDIMNDLGTFGGPNSGVGFWGRRPNERGQIAGAAQTSDPDPLGEDFCAFDNNFFSEPPAPFVCHPFVWQDDVLNPLPTLEGNGVASQINNSGLVAGGVDGEPDCTPGTPHPRPVLWASGVLHELPLLAGTLYGGPNALNDEGQAAGVLVSDCAASVASAALWEHGSVTYLGSLGGTANDEAVDINNKGNVVGFSSLPGNAVFHAFLWTKSTGMHDLGTLPGDVGSLATGINSRGEIVGFSCSDAACLNTRAFLLENGAMLDLNSLISVPNLFLVLAFDINSRGQIVGLDFDTITQQAHGFLATPCDEGNSNDEGCKDTIAAQSMVAQRRNMVLPENVRRMLRQGIPFGRH